MEKKRSTKIIAVISLLFAIVAATIVFASRKEILNISGIAKMEPEGSWDIKFVNVGAGDFVQTFTSGSAVSNSAPTLSTTSITGIDVTLKEPGDKVEYNFNIVNAGVLDAVVESISKNTPTFTGLGATASADRDIVRDNLIFNLTYANDYSYYGGAGMGGEIAAGHTLPAESGVFSTRNMTLTIGYRNPPVGSPGVPTAPVNISNLGIAVTYVQD